MAGCQLGMQHWRPIEMYSCQKKRFAIKLGVKRATVFWQRLAATSGGSVKPGAGGLQRKSGCCCGRYPLYRSPGYVRETQTRLGDKNINFFTVYSPSLKGLFLSGKRKVCILFPACH